MAKNPGCNVQPVRLPVSNPGLVIWFALAGWIMQNAATAAKAKRSLGKAFMPN